MTELTMMIGAVRSLVLDESAVLLGHDTGYYLTRSLLWSALLVALVLPLVAVRYRRA